MRSKVQIPISGDKLAKRWGVEPVDILYIMINHDLDIISDELDNRMDFDMILDVHQDTGEELDPNSFLFRFSEVQKLENDYLKNPVTTSKQLVRGRMLLAKWDLGEHELFSIAINSEWDFVDPFGYPLDSQLYFKLWRDGILKVADALFWISEVGAFEKESCTIISKLADPIQKRPTISENNNLD